MKLFTSHSREETLHFAEQVAASLEPNTVIALTGALGAGKTTFTQGIAWALGVSECVTSPTFTLIQEYEGTRMPVFHMDLYRLDSVEEFELLGAEDYFFRGGITLIEWSEKAQAILPANTLHIHFDMVPDGSRRLTLWRKE